MIYWNSVLLHLLHASEPGFTTKVLGEIFGHFSHLCSSEHRHSSHYPSAPKGTLHENILLVTSCDKQDFVEATAVAIDARRVEMDHRLFDLRPFRYSGGKKSFKIFKLTMGNRARHTKHAQVETSRGKVLEKLHVRKISPRNGELSVSLHQGTAQFVVEVSQDVICCGYFPTIACITIVTIITVDFTCDLNLYWARQTEKWFDTGKSKLLRIWPLYLEFESQSICWLFGPCCSGSLLVPSSPDSSAFTSDLIGWRRRKQYDMYVCSGLSHESLNRNIISQPLKQRKIQLSIKGAWQSCAACHLPDWARSLHPRRFCHVHDKKQWSVEVGSVACSS